MDFLSGQNIVQGQPQQQPVATYPQQQQVQPSPQAGQRMAVIAVDPADGRYITVDGVRMFTQEQLNGFMGGLRGEKDTLSAKLAQADAEINGYRQRDAARAAGVPDAFMRYALSETNQIAATGKDFNTALSEFVASNSHLWGAPQVAGQQAQQTPVQGLMQQTAQPSGVLQQTAQPNAVPAQQTVAPVVAPQVQQPVAQVPQQQDVVSQPVQPQVPQQQVAPAQTVITGSSGVVGMPGVTPATVGTEAEIDAFLAKKKRKGG